MRTQLMSPTWSRPSTPPRSTKAPKSLTERTTPERTCPSSSAAQVFSRISARSCSRSSRLETTRFFSRWLASVTIDAELLADVDRGVLDAVDVDLADRQEAADAVDLDVEAPLVRLGDLGLDDQALAQVLPVGLDGRPLQGEQEDALGGVEAVDVDLDHVAGLGERLAELLDGDDPFALGAQVDEDALAPDADDLALLQAGARLLAPRALLDVGPVGRPRPAGS